jgi:hypothetical protein
MQTLRASAVLFLKVAHSVQDFLLVLVVVLACLAEAERRLVLETKGKSEDENDDEDDLVAAKGRAVPFAPSCGYSTSEVGLNGLRTFVAYATKVRHQIENKPLTTTCFLAPAGR